jgi:hypothetical protein
MKIITFAGGALLVGMATPAPAQTVADDVQCLVLSNAFAKGASEEAAKQSAARTLVFYLGRLDAHADPQAVKSAMQALKVDPKTASTAMTACATRFQHAVQALQALGSPPEPGNKTPEPENKAPGPGR